MEKMEVDNKDETDYDVVEGTKGPNFCSDFSEILKIYSTSWANEKFHTYKTYLSTKRLELVVILFLDNSISRMNFNWILEATNSCYS